MENIRNLFRKEPPPTDIFSQLRDLRNDVEELKRWKNSKAEPTMNDNATNISNIIREFNESVYPKMNMLKDQADTALAAANDSFNRAKELKNILDASAKGLQSDGEAVWNAAQNMVNVIENELNNIVAAFKQYGIDVGNGIKFVIDQAVALKKRLYAIKDSIIPPLNKVREHAKKLPKLSQGLSIANIGAAAWLPFNLFMMSYYLSWANPNVLGEVTSGFKGMGDEFKKFGDAFVNMRNALRDAPKPLGDKVGRAMDNINGAVVDFLNSFSRLFGNMSYRLQGKLPPAEQRAYEKKKRREEKEAEKKREKETWDTMSPEEKQQIANRYAAAEKAKYVAQEGTKARINCANMKANMARNQCARQLARQQKISIERAKASKQCQDVRAKAREEAFDSQECLAESEKAKERARNSAEASRIYQNTYEKIMAEGPP